MPPDTLQALLGGALIGLSAALLLLTHGRIAGISGILGAALLPAPGSTRDGGFRYAFLLGLLGGGALLGVLWPERFDMSGTPSCWALLLGAGVLVGAGTRIGGGCTSGHGVCGIGRGSRRSIAATLTFMLVAALVVFLRRLS